MPNWFTKMFFEEPCKHEHYREVRTIRIETPWVHFTCYDCSFQDCGHVFGPNSLEDWVGITDTGKKKAA